MKIFTSILFAFLLMLNTLIFAQRGTVVNAIPLDTISPTEIMQSLQLSLDATNYALIDHFTYKNNSVVAVKIIYWTIDGHGNPTTASGVVFIPFVETETEVPVFSYLHGTLTRDIDAPSYLIGIQSIIGWIMAMDGYISILPDYLGLGDGPGIHPFSHAETEASASIDFMIAATTLCASNPLIKAKPNGDLYLSGYSQGAHAALATQRELEKHPIPGLTLRKTVAGSGAYSLSYIQKKFLFDNPNYPNPSFLPYLLMGYQDVYGNLYSNLNQVFVPPYNSTMPGYFNGLLTVEQIDSQLPAAWKDMFVPRYLWNIKYRYFHPVNIALRKNDLINWKPKTDLHLYYCNCDELVAKENSLLAYLSFLLRGSWNVTCLPLGNFNHNDCAPLVLLIGKIQFDCASGINPCGLNLSSLLALKSTSETDLSAFSNALDLNATLDKDLIQSEEFTAYLNGEENLNDQMKVYPNPASDFVTIELNNGGLSDSRIAIYDMQGKLVMDKIFTDNTIELNVKPFKPGVYKVVVNGESTKTKSLAISR